MAAYREVTPTMQHRVAPGAERIVHVALERDSRLQEYALVLGWDSAPGVPVRTSIAHLGSAPWPRSGFAQILREIAKELEAQETVEAAAARERERQECLAQILDEDDVAEEDWGA